MMLSTPTLRRLALGLALVAQTLPVMAAPAAKKPAATATPVAPATPATVTETDVIGSQEAPAVLNIVPWKERPAVAPKKEINTSILRETLQPLDREVLQREIRLYQGQ